MKREAYRDEGYRLMGAAFEVYNNRGYGLAEEIYQECMEIELEIRAIPFHSKAELTCFFKQLLPEHEAQLINYLADCAAPCRLPHQFRL